MLYKTDANFMLVFVKNELFGFNFSAILALFAMGAGEHTVLWQIILFVVGTSRILKK